MSIISKTITTGLVGLLGLGLAACNNDDAAPSNTNEPTQKAAAAEQPAKQDEPKAEEKSNAEDTSADDTGSTGDAKWSVEVDGAAIEIEDATVVCQEAAGTINIAIASTSAPDKALGVQLVAGDTPTVQGVGLLDKEGNALAYAEGAGQGSAEVTKNGNVYEITGEGLVTDMSNPTSMQTKPFSVTVDCG